jgi:hypothetical protein
MQAVNDGLFEVRIDGSVWRHKKRTIWGYRDVAPRRADPPGALGYRYVKVGVKGRQYAMPAHRLVWIRLFGDIPSGLEVNHKNGEKWDNRPANLELVTSSENKLHAFRILKRRRSPGRPKHSSEKREAVMQLRKDGLTYSDIAKRTGVAEATARAIVKKENLAA